MLKEITSLTNKNQAKQTLLKNPTSVNPLNIPVHSNIEMSNRQDSIEEMTNIENISENCIIKNQEKIKNTQSEIYQKTFTERQWTEVRLTSILELIQTFQRTNSHEGLTDIFRGHTFIGCINNSMALIQHQTQLLMVNFTHLSEHLCYQLTLLGFHNFGIIRLNPLVSISELCMAYLENSKEWDETMVPKTDIAKVNYF